MQLKSYRTGDRRIRLADFVRTECAHFIAGRCIFAADGSCAPADCDYFRRVLLKNAPESVKAEVARRTRRRCTCQAYLFAMTVTAILVIAGIAQAADDPFRPLFDALHKWESRSGKVLVGDKGRSLGPYHIGKDYWTDGVRQLRREGFRKLADSLIYKRDVYNRRSCEVIIKAVWRCYEPTAYRAVVKKARPGGFEPLARLHNGGPDWRRKPATVKYWGHIRRLMKTERGKR